MKIFLAEHRGFCYGVKRAVEIAYGCIGEKGKVCTLGPIIHNPQMVSHLTARGVEVAKDLDDVLEGTVIIRSHGVGPEVYRQAQIKNLHLIDATCPHVKKAQQAAHKLLQEGYAVIIVGEKNHPEVKSIMAWTGDNAIIMETVDEAITLPFVKRLGIVAQTTFAGEGFQQIVDALKLKCDELKVERTICTATDLRQQAAVSLAGQVQAILVVGGKNSANTARLARICRESNPRVYHIETAAELDKTWFKGLQTVGITAGASTPEWLIEEVYNKMQELDQMQDNEISELTTGSIVKGKVVGIRKDEVFVDIGYKAEGIIPLSELAYPVPETTAEAVSEGEIIDVYVIDADSAEGNIKLSKIKADKIVAWDKLAAAFASSQTIEGKVTEVVKGGLSVAVFGIRGFMPASQVDIRYVEDLSPFIGQNLEFIPIEVDADKQRVILSRKAVLAERRRLQEEETFAKIQVGQKIKGTVRRLADFGAFVDVGGIDGLVHISDMAWQRVKSPEEIVSVGDEVEVLVLKVDAQAKRISLSLKQLQRDPWEDAVEHFSEDTVVLGKVTKIAKFGAFVELKPGVEGLVPLSELADHRVVSAQEVVTEGQQVNVKILSIDKAAKRIGLSIIRAQQDTERAEYQGYLDKTDSVTLTLGDKFAHLFKREE